MGNGTPALSAALVDEDPAAAAAALEALVRHEDDLVLSNLMKPYEDQIPAVLSAGPATGMAAVLDRLPTGVAKRALFGSYTRIRDARLAELLAAMRPEAVARLLDAMAIGVDAPHEAARVLAGAGAALSPALALVHPAALLRLLDELPAVAQGALCQAAGRAALGGADALLAERGEDRRRAWLRGLLVAAGSHSQGQGRGEPATDLDLLAAGGMEDAARHLRDLSHPDVRAVLRALPPARSAELLTEIAASEPRVAAELLEAADRRLLLRPPVTGTPVTEWLAESRSAAVVAAMDLEDPTAERLLRALRPEHLDLMLPHLPWEQRGRLEQQLGTAGSLPLGIEVLGVGSGQRLSRRLDHGRWVRIEEHLDSGTSRHPVVVDLLELPLGQVRLEARMAVDEARALPVEQLTDVFEGYRVSGTRPSEEDFRRFGLVQLSHEVERTGALGAINGNFYFDYGHYLNGVTLGIDMANVPGLFFGDPIGWFVSNGTELQPPSFNRAAAVVTADGELHLDRVLMDRVTLGDRTLTWDSVNVAKEVGRPTLYTSLFGYRTESSPTHMDVACARGRVWRLDPHGAAVIPLTGFVLSVPSEQVAELLADVEVGTVVRSSSRFERRHGPVQQAMACGPLLVRDGVVDLDFLGEDFGQQDSTVMSFFLPRTVETYRAARSFLGLRGRTLVLGTVSGTAYGFGAVRTSAGTTFGELAQLCVDLGLDTAYALDGGGSSSVVGREGGRTRVLNAPTGGADVAAGQERFINTYWLVHPRQEPA